MFKLLNKIFVFCLLFFTINSFAVIQLELTKGVNNTIKIIVSPFVGQELISSTDNQITSIISNDLKNSGRFCLISINKEISDGNFDFESMHAQKIEGVVTGKVKQLNSGQLQVTFALFDIYNNKKLFEKEYTIKKEQLRKLAHHISDIVYHQFTGSQGVFSTKIAYVLVERHGCVARRCLAKYSLQVADSDGYNPKTLLVSNFPVMSPAWAPDGKKIAYVSFEGNRAAIYIQDVSTGSRKLLTKFPGINSAPAWSPDGKKMAVVLTQTGYPKIYILDLTTNNLERITDGWYLDTEPAWAPDGKSLIFTSDRGGTPQIYRVFVDSKKVERITYDGSYNARASFTSDGKTIVMLCKQGNFFSIAKQDLQSGTVSILTQSGFNESPSIAPNGKMVVYATNSGSRGILAEVSIDGYVKIALPSLEYEVQEPAWSPFLD